MYPVNKLKDILMALALEYFNSAFGYHMVDHIEHNE